MLRGIIAAAILAMAATAAAAGPAHRGLPDESKARVISVSTHSDGTAHQRLTMALDKAAIVQLDTDARDVLVSNPGVVDAVVRSPRRIFLIANKTGQTNAFFFDGAGHQILSIDIRVERDVTDLGGMLRDNFPDSTIKVSAMNDNVVLTGTIGSAMDSTRAQDLAARFAGGADKVVNMLKIDAGEQVMLKVRIVEVQREIAKQFGINLEAAANAAGVPIMAATANPFGLVGRALSDASGVQVGSVGASPGAGPNNVQGILKALEQVGLVHTLAEPNLTAVSGETAKFLAGGEFPVPGGRDSQGNVAVVFKEFGVGLSFTPVVLSRGRISMQISTEVSELTNTGSFTLQGGTSVDSKGNVVTVGGLTIPALRVRRAETTIELPSGGSFAIAGLLQHTSKQVLDSFPGLKDMPVLGALFRSRDYQNDET
jgi:pilus assembly protein CpaC